MDDTQRYIDAVHAMQTGVATMMYLDNKETSPKHLRVGINCSMSDHGALVSLLVDKGVITMEEYKKYITDFMNKEVETYNKMIKEYYPGADVTLV